jgi:DNA (cytosine-5)-methyltransferase 1
VNRPPAIRLHIDEIIVDSFAGGGGASLGIEWALGRSPDVAINHDPEAIAMHQANHPGTRHYCEDVWHVDPVEACRGRAVGLAWFSPDCKHFSKAKGGKPVDKKIRALAWIVIRWAKAVQPRVIILENVEEFEDWGPVLENGRPCPERVGLTFRIWLGKLRALGYAVEWREMVAADYGAPTTRKRLFLVARRDGQTIVWPKPTHGKMGAAPWRTAAECIEWSLPTYSIFLTSEEAKRHGVRRPLAENTERRIARGLKRFVIDCPEPFIVGVGGRMGQSPERFVSRPMQTVTAKGDAALVTPFLTERANGSNQRTFSVVEPLRTQCAQVKGGHFAIVAPTLITTGYGERPGQAPRVPGLNKPLGTVVGTMHHALVAAFLAKHYGGHETPGAPLAGAMDTVTARDHHALVASSLVKMKGTGTGQQLDLPLHTVQAGGNHYGEVRAFLLKYYGTDQDPRLERPLHTLTSKDRMALVTVHGEPYVIADIGMRMLAPRELYRAQGFADDYLIVPVVNGKPLSKKAQVRMVGNSVCPPLAAAVARAQFEDQAIEVAA